MPDFKDSEFGTIKLRRSRLAKAVRLRCDMYGTVTIFMPMRTPVYVAKGLLNSSRANIRQMLADIQAEKLQYTHGDLIGKSHRLVLENRGDSFGSRLAKNELQVWLPESAEPQLVQSVIDQGVAKAMRAQAKTHLPDRLEKLAFEHQFSYQKLRYSSAKTRWGSCSARGTISLNIWLMQLPFELIDYVIIHELCHTKELNHSPKFWDLVANCCPNYTQLKSELKRFHP